MNPDPCCWACKSPTGACLSRRACEHHVVAEAQDEINHRAGKQYSDPTADRAIRNIERARKGR